MVRSVSLPWYPMAISVSPARDPVAPPVSPLRDPTVPPVYLSWNSRVPSVYLPRDPMALPVSPVRGPVAPLVSPPRDSAAPPVSPSSEADGASCVFCLRCRDAGCCFSSNSCTSSCGATLLPTDLSSPGFTSESSLPTQMRPVLSGASIHCTAYRFAFACKRPWQNPCWPGVAIPTA